MEMNLHSTERSLSHEVARLSDIIHSCERLCLLTTRTLLLCAAASPRSEGDEAAPLAFIPSVSRNLQSVPSLADRNPHPTTSAHCVTALQSLLPVIGRFQLGTHESKGLAFHPLERDSLDAFKPKRLSAEIRSTIDRALKGLESSHEKVHSKDTIDIPSEQGAASQPLPAGAQWVADRETSTFGDLHPFRAAQVLRAIAPSHAIFHSVAWTSIFAVVWYLHRRIGSPRGYPNIQETDSPGTAFLTSKCVEAIETVMLVFERRRERFKRLIELMMELRRIVKEQNELTDLDGKLISQSVFSYGCDYKTSILIPEVRACVADLACDSALPETYTKWSDELTKAAHTLGLRKGFKSAEDFLSEIVTSFRSSMRTEKVKQEHKTTRQNIREGVEKIESIVETVGRVHSRMRECTGNGQAQSNERALAVTKYDLQQLPNWICSEDYWVATNRALDASQASPEILDTLEMHWARHRDAADHALKTVRAFQDYVERILDDFGKMEAEISENPDLASVDNLLDISGDATRYLVALRKQLSNDLDAGVRWAEVVMNRHLAYAASGATAQFDPNELAHAVRVMCRDTGRVRFSIILKALQVVASSQRTDGTWSCQQPFYWKETGFALWAMSTETASAVVSTLHILLTNPERYGAGLGEISEGVKPIHDALDRFFRWLSGSVQSFPAPPALRNGDRLKPHPAGTSVQHEMHRQISAKKRAEPPLYLYGWCSDRLPDSEHIHSWATAIAIEFLVEFRRLMQDRINASLRAEFVSHHPSELIKLSEVEPTDLRNIHKRNEQGPVIAWLMKLLREHKKLQIAEGPWMPFRPSEPKIAFWSALLYGPPGTSKTFLAKAIAAELGWPLISVNPSDFLANGNAHIEPTAQEIFAALSVGSRIVVFLDEIDELIRDRRQEQDQRSALSFLTPSFLAKLQDFHDFAKKNEFIFILATNYKDRIDSAAIRSGRIDQFLPVMYPDLESRANIILRELTQKSKNNEPAEQFQYVRDYLRKVQSCLQIKERKGKFLDELAKHSGFLSHQKIKSLLELLPTNPDDKNFEWELEQVIKAISDMSKNNAGPHRPEISLAVYSDRRDALKEEVLPLTDIIPQTTFPWHEDKETSGTEEQSSMLERELKALYEAIENEKILAQFKDLYKNRPWKRPWAEESAP